MHPNHSSGFLASRSLFATFSLFALLAVAPVLSAQDRPKNPTGKIYVVSVEGASQFSNGDEVVALAVKSVFVAQGSRIETKPAGTVAMVLSNGTGFSLDKDTSIDVKRFTQEAFVANRTNLDAEPSTSVTLVAVTRGTLAVSTSKLAAGSTMNFTTSLGSINLRGGNVVIEATGDYSKFSLLAGEGTVHGGDLDPAGHVVHTGEQAVIFPGQPGQPNIVKIGKIPAEELEFLDARVTIAYEARKTVFFDTDASGEVTAVPVVAATVPVSATVSPSRLPR